jgi:hypothetical protein
MVPAVYVRLDRIPLSPNGKVDRAAFPEPDAAASAPVTTEPLRDDERELAGIWSEVLDLEGIGPDDDFFVLGGHSLLALRLVSRVRARLDSPITVDTVFDYPTVRSMAVALARSR